MSDERRFSVLSSSRRTWFTILVPNQVLVAGGHAAPGASMHAERYVGQLEVDEVPRTGDLFELRAGSSFVLFQVQQVRLTHVEGHPDGSRTTIGMLPVEASMTPDRLRAWLAERGFRKE